MFQKKIDGAIITPSLDSRGYAIDYHLPELEAKMFVAKKNINYLEKITEFWINQNRIPEKPTLVLSDWAIEANSIKHVLSGFDAPQSMIATENMKHIHQIGGPDLRDKVGELPCSQNIKKEDIMLEPIELGKTFGISAIKMNRTLEAYGLQEKISGGWIPTQKGAQMCSRISQVVFLMTLPCHNNERLQN